MHGDWAVQSAAVTGSTPGNIIGIGSGCVELLNRVALGRGFLERLLQARIGAILDQLIDARVGQRRGRDLCSVHIDLVRLRLLQRDVSLVVIAQLPQANSTRNKFRADASPALSE